MTDPADRGAGTVGTSLGFVVFLVLLLGAVQLLFNLYATSMVTTAAFDAARAVAGHDAGPDRCGATRAAEADLRAALGDYARQGELTLTWTCDDPDLVRLRVRATNPSVLPASLGGIVSLGTIDRTVEVRVETLR